MQKTGKPHIGPGSSDTDGDTDLLAARGSSHRSIISEGARWRTGALSGDEEVRVPLSTAGGWRRPVSCGGETGCPHPTWRDHMRLVSLVAFTVG